VCASPGAGTLFPQPRLSSGELMDKRFGTGWRLVSDGSWPLDAVPGLQCIDLAQTPEAEGVVAAWMQRHGVHAAIVRPDHYTYGSAASAEALAAMLDQWRAA
jgi:3-(3-hydroxy-phenyl)propionate hydroxylase